MASRLHPREQSILLEIEKGYNTQYMEEEDHIHSTQLPSLIAAPVAAAMAEGLLPLAALSHPRERSAASRRSSIDFGVFCFIVKGESPPSIWSLGTLTGLSEILR